MLLPTLYTVALIKQYSKEAEFREIKWCHYLSAKQRLNYQVIRDRVLHFSNAATLILDPSMQFCALKTLFMNRWAWVGTTSGLSCAIFQRLVWTCPLWISSPNSTDTHETGFDITKGFILLWQTLLLWPKQSSYRHTWGTTTPHISGYFFSVPYSHSCSYGWSPTVFTSLNIIKNR